MWRIFHRRQPLHRARIGQPECPDVSIRPRLLCCPLDRVVPVAPLILVRRKLAIRRIPPAHILNHHGIPAFHCLLKHGPFLGRVHFSVRRAIHQSRESPLGLRQPNVGTQHHTVAHWHGYISSTHDLFIGPATSNRAGAQQPSARNSHDRCQQNNSRSSHAAHSIRTRGAFAC